MTVAWTDFLAIAAIVNELYHAIRNFVARGKNHGEIRNAAEKYCRCFEDPARDLSRMFCLEGLKNHYRPG